jgi:hypothetical protein
MRSTDGVDDDEEDDADGCFLLPVVLQVGELFDFRDELSERSDEHATQAFRFLAPASP